MKRCIFAKRMFQGIVEQQQILRFNSKFSKEKCLPQTKTRKTLPTARSMSGKPSETAAMASISFDDPDVSKFLDDAFQIIKKEALMSGTNRETPVVNFKHPHELLSALNPSISEEPASHESLLEDVRKIIQYSVKSGHPHFFNQLFGGLDPYSQVGAWLSTSLNVNIHTYEASPVFITLEKFLFPKICKYLGFEHGDGIFCPGGSASNFFALHLARSKTFPEIKTKGLFGSAPLRMYVSEDGHYSMKKAASYLGMGIDNVVQVKTDKRGRMTDEDLERCIKADIEQGYKPAFVMATSATTVLGAYDDLTAIAGVCRKYGVWLHVDACWGGGALLSKKHRHLMTGSEMCDSIAWNFHKFTGTPIQCSALLVNDPTGKLMEEANSVKAEYLFQPDKFYDTSYDIGDKTVQCGRNVDIVKLYLQWRALGDSGMEARIDKAWDNARYFTERLKNTEGFRLVLPEFECTNICFWFIPMRLRGQTEDELWWKEVSKVAPKIKERMMKAGSMMIAYQPLSSKGFVNFFRIIIHNPLCSHADMDFVVDEIERLGHDL